MRHDTKTGLPRPAGRGEFAVAPAKHTDGGGMRWIEGVEVGKKVTEWPTWILCSGRGVQEADDLFGTRSAGGFHE